MGRKRRGRGDGEGTIYQVKSGPRKGTWMAQVSLGYDSNGKRKRRSLYGRTRGEVAEKLTKLLREMQTGTYIEPTKITVGEWIDRWLTGYKKGELTASTYQSYEQHIKAHIKPALGSIRLTKLQTHTLQDFYNKKLENGRIDGTSGLSTRMVHYFHSIIRQALQQAVKEGLLARNVADATSPPVIRNKKMRPLTEKELLIFFDKAKDDRLFAAYVVCATTGLRRGELLGLCWDSVDLKNGAITVQRQLLALKDGPALEDTTKTESGRRSVTLTDDAVKELKAHRKRQAREKLLLGEVYQDNGIVFCKADGTFLDPWEFTRRFQRLLDAAKLPRVRLHDLRHTHATLLLQKGVHPKIVQERLGHSSITMTLDLYSHVVPGIQEQAARALDGLMKGKGPAKEQGTQ